MSALTKRLREHAALHGDIGRFNDEQAQWERDLLDAADYIDNDEEKDVHSCHDRCQRLECVQRREIERLIARGNAWADENTALRAANRDLQLHFDVARERIAQLERELAEYKSEAPLCAEHQPTGGARARCLVCALQELSAAISRIDYELGEPNDMEVSGYDVHYNPEPVIVGARNARRELAEARGLLQQFLEDCACDCALDLRQRTRTYLTRTDQPAPLAYHETHEPPHCPTCDCAADQPTARHLTAGERQALDAAFEASIEVIHPGIDATADKSSDA